MTHPVRSLHRLAGPCVFLQIKYRTHSARPTATQLTPVVVQKTNHTVSRSSRPALGQTHLVHLTLAHFELVHDGSEGIAASDVDVVYKHAADLSPAGHHLLADLQRHRPK
eukprot:1661701-Pyramimonas_sp.AAC.1